MLRGRDADSAVANVIRAAKAAAEYVCDPNGNDDEVKWMGNNVMTKFGQVIAYHQETGMATIAYARPEACAKCGGCGTAGHQGTICLQADCAEGTWVRIELPKARFLQAATITYALPLTGLLLGLALGYLGGGKTDVWTLAGGALGLGLSFVVIWLNERRIAGRPEWRPHVVDVYAKKPTLEEIGCGGGDGQC